MGQGYGDTSVLKHVHVIRPDLRSQRRQAPCAVFGDDLGDDLLEEAQHDALGHLALPARALLDVRDLGYLDDGLACRVEFEDRSVARVYPWWVRIAGHPRIVHGFA